MGVSKVLQLYSKVISWRNKIDFITSQNMPYFFKTLISKYDFGPVKLMGPVSYFEIKVSRKLGCVLASNEVYFVSLAENFTV